MVFQIMPQPLRLTVLLPQHLINRCLYLKLFRFFLLHIDSIHAENRYHHRKQEKPDRTPHPV